MESGIQDNRVVAGGGPGGLLARLDRDVLSSAGLRTVVVQEGLPDLLHGAGDQAVEAIYGTLRDQLKAWGVKAVFTSLTPCAGHALCTSAVDVDRATVNSWLSEQQDFTAPYVDTFDAEAIVGVADSDASEDQPVMRLSAGEAPLDYGAGDHVNLSRQGYAALGNALDLQILRPDAMPGGAGS